MTSKHISHPLYLGQLHYRNKVLKNCQNGLSTIVCISPTMAVCKLEVLGTQELFIPSQQLHPSGAEGLRDSSRVTDLQPTLEGQFRVWCRRGSRNKSNSNRVQAPAAQVTLDRQATLQHNLSQNLFYLATSWKVLPTPGSSGKTVLPVNAHPSSQKCVLWFILDPVKFPIKIDNHSTQDSKQNYSWKQCVNDPAQ